MAKVRHNKADPMCMCEACIVARRPSWSDLAWTAAMKQKFPAVGNADGPPIDPGTANENAVRWLEDWDDGTETK